MVPFGLDEDCLAGGVAGEGLLGEFVPEGFDFSLGLDIVVLVLRYEFGVSFQDVLAGGADVFRVEKADRGVGQHGVGAIRGGDDNETVASNVEGVHSWYTKGRIVVLHD